ncbi:MAG: phenylalanine--tRNA ligase subunit beta [Clostridium sp.]|nr:phenylalanine--tRNA ligase subunit beta [Prevotella sp.]MCM1428990.1 phenylalanine--tRNA ligase subunit beta [Clostridium sp.]MCM1475480.1 phenylalanine--tRNA ligase subunit beta [Muribaculaceae bacterium]
MDISYKWLKRFIDFSLSARELTAALTSLGLECDTVEEVESIRGGLRGVVVGKVLTCEDHPDSDHLHITTVDLGTDTPATIVCGAPNVAAGQTVVVATVGTILYQGDKEFKIKKSKIRGVESFGMICAEDELGLGNAHDGIMVLPDNLKPGTPAAEVFGVESDYRLVVELTPNRVDAASHYGTARDLKAWLMRQAYDLNPKSEMPSIDIPDDSSFSIDSPEGAASVKVEDTQACPRYSGITIRGVKVAESPDWLKNLLIAVGQRPINNIVDITNFILLGLGQPLHCFDLAHVKDESIVVRTCAEGTPFVTLDGVEHKLNSADLMICDSEKPLCIAGVFGGLNSGVTESTTDVFIESAWFNATSVRRTARRHGLSTDASFRYERGTDPNITVYAARLAAVMIRELAGGRICGDVVDILNADTAPVAMDFSLSYCRRLIGKEIPSDLIVMILKALEIDVQPGKDDDTLSLKVPRYRVDVTRPCDVVEEILRVYGYNNVEMSEETHATLSRRGPVDFSYQLQQLVSDMLTDRGYVEILNNSLTAKKYYADSERWPEAGCVHVLNPLSGDLSLMRRSLLYGGLESLSHNINRKATDLRMYEFGNVYEQNPEAESTAEAPLAPFKETPMLGIWLTGNYTSASWNTKQTEASVFDLKGDLFDILRRLGLDIRSLTQQQDSDEIFSARLSLTMPGGKKLGELGILRSTLLRKFDIEQNVMYAEINWKVLFKAVGSKEVFFKELPKTQPVRRDFALLIDKNVSFDTIERTVRKAERKLLGDVRLFDVYEGKNLPEGKKSYAISITLQDMEKTLDDRRIDQAAGRIVDALRKELGAELR